MRKAHLNVRCEEEEWVELPGGVLVVWEKMCGCGDGSTEFGKRLQDGRICGEIGR